MHFITISGALADDLGEVKLQRIADAAAAYAHAAVMLSTDSDSEHHAGHVIRASAPATKPVCAVKLAWDQWMLQARHGKHHDGAPYNAAGNTMTFKTRHDALAWLANEPAGRWELVR